LIKVIIFDIGGVTIKEPMSSIYKDVGREFKTSAERIKQKYLEIDSLISTNKISAKKFWWKLAKKLQIEDVGLLETIWIKSLKENAPFNKNVVKLINDLKEKGYKVATLSNTLKPHEKVHRKAGCYKFFSKVFLSDRLGMKKPDAEIYRYVSRALNVRPDECVFIDDKLENVVGARKVGMKAILFKNAQQLGKEVKRYL